MRPQPQFSHYFVNMLRPQQLQARRENQKSTSKSQECLNRKPINDGDLTQGNRLNLIQVPNAAADGQMSQEAPPSFTSFYKPRTMNNISGKVTEINILNGKGRQDEGDKCGPSPQDYDSSEYLKGIGTNHYNAFRTNQAKYDRSLVESELGSKRATVIKVQSTYQSPLRGEKR